MADTNLPFGGTGGDRIRQIASPPQPDQPAQLRGGPLPALLVSWTKVEVSGGLHAGVKGELDLREIAFSANARQT